MELFEVERISIIIRILGSILLGGLIGIDRGMKNRPAGLRTYMLVSMGACLIMLTNQYVFLKYQIGDPVRMGAQVVSGIGFLGAGTIVVTRSNRIKGLTTAAGLWAAAAVGLAIGIGFYDAAVLGSVTVFIVLTLVHPLDVWMHRRRKVFDVYFELSEEVGFREFLIQLHKLGIAIEHIQTEHTNPDTGIRAYITTLHVKKNNNQLTISESLSAIKGMVHFEVM